MTIVEPSSLSWRSIRITSSPWAVSRLPVGSSARISLGSPTRARATATRCCWPPDNWRRTVLGAVGDADLVEHRVDPRLALGAPGCCDRASASSTFSRTDSSSTRLKLWKMKPMCCLRVSASCDFGQAGDLLAVEDIGPAGRAIEHAHDVEQGRLAAARRPHDRDEFAVGNVEVDAVERGRLDGVGAVGLGQAGHGQHGSFLSIQLAGCRGRGWSLSTNPV